MTTSCVARDSDTVVCLNDVTKKYGKLVALDSVSLKIRRGELFGLIGPDGAGKSTAYKILATLLHPDSGSASVLGMDIVKDFRSIRSEIGYMPEQFSLYQDLTVKENLDFFATLFGTTLRDSYDLVAPVLGQLEKFPNRAAGHLSGGMKQKLALACALIHRPHLLLLDEPTTGVDAVSRSEFWDLLATLRKKEITIMVSTSYMDEASRCSCVAMIDHGHILMTDTPEKLTASIGKRLYNAKAPDMFRLLNTLREMPEVEDCYTFGSTLHLSAREDFNPVEAVARLTRQGIADPHIYPAQGTLEDLFIKLRNDA